MNKRENKALAATIPVIFIMVVASVFMFSFLSGYRLKDGPVIAGETGIEHITKENVKDTARYFSRQGVNTVILKLDKTATANQQKLINKAKSAFARKKIQTYISLDCKGITNEDVLNTIAYIHENYKVIGVVLDNYSGENLEWINKQLKTGRKQLELIVQTDNTELIKNSSYTADGFIAENISADSYKQLKAELSNKILLHYTSQNMPRDVFMLTNFDSLDGAVITSYTGENTPLLLEDAFYKNENLPLFNLSVSTDFKVTYPTKDFTTYYSGFYITGTGQSYGTVTVNGTDYTAEKDGTFGIYYELEKGENLVTISQNEQSKQFTVTKKTYKNTGIKYELPWDETQWISYGQIVATTGPLTSMLSDPDDDSAIIAGLEAGTKMKVVDVVKTTRNGKQTYAYKLSNSAFVMANKVEILKEVTSSYYNPNNIDLSDYIIYSAPKLGGISIEKLKNGDEIMTMEITNMPAVITDFSEESLKIHFLDAQLIDENITLPQSQFFTAGNISEEFNGTIFELTLNPDNMLWGYDVSVTEGKVQIYLKKSPKLLAGDKPLKDITILLDAGHGGYDSGAVGVAVYGGPMEKDLNLAVSTATKTLLEQWGATVVMTREDDSFPSLDDRRNLTRQIKPDLFIAQHHNSMDYSYNSTDTMGSESYYFTRQSEKLATLLCDEITQATGRRNLGADTGYYYVTRNDICPAVLMEYSFIINPKDYRNTYSDSDIYNAAWGTLQAVLKAIPQ